MVRRWVIEHRTRGTLTDIDADGKPHFNWTDPEGSGKHWVFESHRKAELVLSFVPMPVQARCYIREIK